MKRVPLLVWITFDPASGDWSAWSTRREATEEAKAMRKRWPNDPKPLVRRFELERWASRRTYNAEPCASETEVK